MFMKNISFCNIFEGERLMFTDLFPMRISSGLFSSTGLMNLWTAYTNNILLLLNLQAIN